MLTSPDKTVRWPPTGPLQKNATDGGCVLANFVHSFFLLKVQQSSNFGPDLACLERTNPG